MQEEVKKEENVLEDNTRKLQSKYKKIIKKENDYIQNSLRSKLIEKPEWVDYWYDVISIRDDINDVNIEIIKDMQKIIGSCFNKRIIIEQQRDLAYCVSDKGIGVIRYWREKAEYDFYDINEYLDILKSYVISYVNESILYKRCLLINFLAFVNKRKQFYVTNRRAFVGDSVSKSFKDYIYCFQYGEITKVNNFSRYIYKEDFITLCSLNEGFFEKFKSHMDKYQTYINNTKKYQEKLRNKFSGIFMVELL